MKLVFMVIANTNDYEYFVLMVIANTQPTQKVDEHFLRHLPEVYLVKSFKSLISKMHFSKIEQRT